MRRHRYPLQLLVARGYCTHDPVIGMYERNAGASRRSFLAAAGGAATVGLAGCLGGDDGGLNELTVAHMPIYPTSSGT